MFFEILRNISILLAFCMIYSLLFQSRDRSSLAGRCWLGIIFGIAGILAMLSPTALFPGVLIDGRSIFISMAGLLGGWISALIAVVISMACRIILGGTGVWVGVGIILTAALVGAVYHHLLRENLRQISNLQLWGFGIVVHVFMICLLPALPSDIRWEVVRLISVPVLLIYPAGTVLVGRLLMNQDEQAESKRMLADNQERLSSILRVVPTGIGMVKDRMFTELNPRISEITGYSYDELIGKSSRILYPSEEEFLRVGHEKYAQIQKQGTGVIETKWKRSDGSIRDILLSSTPLHENNFSDGVIFTALDITGRKQAENALQQSMEELKLHMEQTPLAVVRWDMDFKVVEWNRAAEQIFGFSRGEAIGKHGSFIVPENQKGQVEQAWNQLMANRGGVRNANENITKDGQIIVCEWYNVPLVDDSGKVFGVASQVMDVTEHQISEQKIEWLSRFPEENPNPVLRIHESGTIIYANKSADVLLHAWERRVREKLPDDLQKIVQKAITFGILKIEKAVADKTFLLGFAPVVSEGYVNIYAQDITDRKRAEEERERLMQAIEQSAEIVIITDLNANIQYVNPTFTKVTGYTREEVIGINPRILKSGEHPPGFYRKMWGMLSEGKPWSGTLVNKRKDGTVYSEDATISPVCGPTGEVSNYVAVKRDISRELELEGQLRQAQKMEAVGQMAGGIAHDFNNLLQVIGGYAELSLMEMDEDSRCGQALLEIQEASTRGKTLVSQLLAFSRRQVIRPVDLNLNDVIKRLVQMIRGLIGEHIELDFIAGHNLATIHADHGLMEQVMMNLCVNARDAMPDGGKIVIETENVLIDGEYARTHTWASVGRYVLLCVTDNGCGMDQRTQEHIFEPFFTTKEVGKGTGLGLSTVFGIIKQHGGHVNTYSELGKGTIFKIYLPTVERKATQVSRKAPGPVSGGTETLLVAEDDQTVLKLAEHLLTEAGYTVLTARDGVEAVRVFEKHMDEIDGIMLDVVMPQLGGKQAMERIFELRPDVPHLFASGYSENAVHTNFIQKHGLHLISKPYQAETLLRKIREIFDDESPDVQPVADADVQLK